MKAALLKSFGSPLSVETVADPEIGTGEVIVDIVAARVLAYSNEVISGQRKFVLDLPCVFGAGGVGRVRSTGPDATKLAVGDWVFVDPTVRSRDDALVPDIVLQGLTAAGPGGVRLQKYFRDGSWAQQTRVPTENAIPIGKIDEADAPRWCALGSLVVPYGGFLASALEPGELVVVSGATGAFGSAGVAVALAMGARAVIATGRSEKALAELAARFGKRVIPVVMKGDEEKDRKSILAAAPTPIDCVLDILPPAAKPEQVRAALMTVRPGGRVVLMGGVNADLAIPYAWMMRNNVTVRGQWMFPRTAIAGMANLVHAGLIDLSAYDVTAFPLDRVGEAVEHAAENAGPFAFTVLSP